MIDVLNPNDQASMTNKAPMYNDQKEHRPWSVVIGNWSFVGHWNLDIVAFPILRPISVLCCLFILGCADSKGPSTRPTSLRERQDAALQDPFNYNPDMPSTGKGGDLSNFDRDGFNQDLKRVFNP